MRRGVCASFYRLKSRLRITVQMIFFFFFFFFECALALVHPRVAQLRRASAADAADAAAAPRPRLFPPDFLAATLFCIASRIASAPAIPARSRGRASARFELKRNLKPLPMLAAAAAATAVSRRAIMPRQRHETTRWETNGKMGISRSVELPARLGLPEFRIRASCPALCDDATRARSLARHRALGLEVWLTEIHASRRSRDKARCVSFSAKQRFAPITKAYG